MERLMRRLTAAARDPRVETVVQEWAGRARTDADGLRDRAIDSVVASGPGDDRTDDDLVRLLCTAVVRVAVERAWPWFAEASGDQRVVRCASQWGGRYGLPADDLRQDAVLRSVRSRAGLGRPDDAVDYLCGAIRNVAADHGAQRPRTEPIEAGREPSRTDGGFAAVEWSRRVDDAASHLDRHGERIWRDATAALGDPRHADEVRAAARRVAQTVFLPVGHPGFGDLTFAEMTDDAFDGQPWFAERTPNPGTRSKRRLRARVWLSYVVWSVVLGSGTVEADLLLRPFTVHHRGLVETHLAAVEREAAGLRSARARNTAAERIAAIRAHRDELDTLLAD